MWLVVPVFAIWSSFTTSLAVEHFPRARDHVIGGNSEFLIQALVWSRRAKVVETDDLARVPDPAVPRQRARRLHGDAMLEDGRQHFITIRLGLPREHVQAGHADDAYADVVGEELLRRGEQQVHLRPAPHENQLGRTTFRILQDVAAAHRLRRAAEPRAI